MKSNIKKKSRYGISILMIAIVLTMIPTGMAAVTVNRSIDSTNLTAGNSTNVTVVIVNNGTDKALSLLETIPTGWTLTRGFDTADQFKSSTNEWVWLTIKAGATQTVIYKIKVPANETAGVYNIKGNLTDQNGSAISVTGDNAITVINNKSVPPVKTNGSFDLVVSPASAIINIGASATYTLTINNLDSAEDTYSLTTNKPKNVTVSLANNSVTVGAGGSADIEMTVNGSSIGEYIVNVTATSKVNKSSSKNVTTTTDVVKTPTVVNGFNFVASPTTATINVGASATYTLTVSNIGGTEDTYSLATGSMPSNATANLANKSVTVGPGNSSNVALTVSGSVTGTYTVNVTATSGANKSNVKNVTTTTNVIVKAPPSPSSGSSGGSGSGGGTYPTFTATPQGTPTETLTVTPVETAVIPTETVTATEAIPTQTISETPVDMATKKGSPGFGIVIAIGMLGAIYILRRMK